MKTNSKQQNRSYALGVLLLLMTIIMVGCVYLDSINLNQGTEEKLRNMCEGRQPVAPGCEGVVSLAKEEDC